MVGMDGKPDSKDLLMKRLSDIVSMCESIDDNDDGRDPAGESTAFGLTKLQEMNTSLSMQLRRAEEALRFSEEKLQAGRDEVQRLKMERDKASAESSQALAEVNRAATDRSRAQRSEQELREARQEAFATAACALSAMQGLLQCVGEQAGRIEAKCALIQQQPAETPMLLDRISRCKRIAREDLPAAADRGVRLRNQLTILSEAKQNLPGAKPFSKLALEFNAAVDTLKDDYTSIELELDRIYEDVRLAQSGEADMDDDGEERADEAKKKSTRRVMMSPEPPQVRMFEESEAALEERRKHWNKIEVEAQRLTMVPHDESMSDEGSSVESGPYSPPNAGRSNNAPITLPGHGAHA